MICTSLPSPKPADRGRLEVCGARAGSSVSVDIYDSVRAGHLPNHSAGAQPVRQHATDRRDVLEDRQEEDGAAQNGQRECIASARVRIRRLEVSSELDANPGQRG